MRRHISTARAFTLVELLVVIGIIVILIGILLPVLVRAKQQAQQTACAANLHQLGVAMTMYTGQYKSFPVAGIQLEPEVAACWPVRLRNILGNQGVFYCPAQDSKCQWKPDAAGAIQLAEEIHTNFGYQIGERLLLTGDGSGDGAWFSYGINSIGAIGGPGFSFPRGVGIATYSKHSAPPYSQASGTVNNVTAVRKPSEFILIADTMVDGNRDTEIRCDPADAQVLVGNVHRNGANVLFLDGHVQWYLQSDLIVKFLPVAEKASKQRMWNADGEPSQPWP